MDVARLRATLWGHWGRSRPQQSFAELLGSQKSKTALREIQKAQIVPVQTRRLLHKENQRIEIIGIHSELLGGLWSTSFHFAMQNSDHCYVARWLHPQWAALQNLQSVQSAPGRCTSGFLGLVEPDLGANKLQVNHHLQSRWPEWELINNESSFYIGAPTSPVAGGGRKMKQTWSKDSCCEIFWCQKWTLVPDNWIESKGDICMAFHLYWLFHRDPYSGLLYNHRITGL